jgi:hypothetical protein
MEKPKVTKEEVNVSPPVEKEKELVDKSEAKEEVNVSPPVEELVPEDINLELGETATACNVSVTVNAVRKVKNYVYWNKNYEKEKFVEAPQDKVYILVNTTVKNLGRDSIDPDSTDFSITDAEGNVYERSLEGIADYYKSMDAFKSKKVYKGQKNSGIIKFMIPERARGLKVLFNFGSNRVCGLFARTTLAGWLIPDDIPVEELKKEVSIEIKKIDAGRVIFSNESRLYKIEVRLTNTGEVTLESLSYKVIVLYNNETVLISSSSGKDLKKKETKEDTIYIGKDLPGRGPYTVKVIVLFKEKEEIATTTKTFTI